MLQKKDKNVATAEAMKLEAQDRIRSLALPILPHENTKALWRKVSRKTGLTARRVRSLWYGQANTIHAHELEVIRSMSDAIGAIEQSKENTKDVRTEIAELRERLDRVIEMLGELANERA